MRTHPGSAGPLSHDRCWLPGIVQTTAPPGQTDLGLGYLDPALLPVDLLRDAYREALSEFGSAALSYGEDRGAQPLRAALAGSAAASPESAQVVVTAGTSQALHLIATTFAAPGDVVLVDQTCYDLARRILVDCGLTLRQVPGDALGTDPAALRTILDNTPGTAFFYTNPTFHNPTGAVLPESRRRQLLAVTHEHETLVVEDDAYAGLSLSDREVPPTLAELARHRGVIRLRTFSKTLAPGLRLGWLETSATLADRLGGHGLFHSGGSLNHTTSLAVLCMLRSGAYDRHLRWLRSELRARRDALAGGLATQRSGVFDFTVPDGGFFLWLGFGAGQTEPELLAAAERACVRVAAGSRFGTTRQPSLRLSYSFHHPERLAEIGARLTGEWSRVSSN